MCRRNTVKEVLLTDKLDKSEVQHQGLYDDVVKATVIFDVRSGRSFVSALSARRSWRISRCPQFAAHVLSICGGSGPANVHFAECSLEGRLGCGSPARCPLFAVLASASFNWRLPADFFKSFAATVLSQGRPRREARRGCVRSTARPSMGRSVCAREAPEIEVPRRLWAKQVHHTAQARAQADTHTPVHVAMWCSCFCCACPSSDVFGRHIENGHACSPKGTPHQHRLVLTESEHAFTEFTRNPHEGIGARPMPSEDETSLATRSQQNHSFVVLPHAPS